jgi:DNA-binding PadR family transcriptional regulator
MGDKSDVCYELTAAGRRRLASQQRNWEQTADILGRFLSLGETS